MSIRVLLADDHGVVRKGLRFLLERQPDMEIVGEAADGREAVRLTEATNPDVVIMDIAMPLLSGIEVTAQMIKRNPAIVVIILSVHSDKDYLLSSLNAGAKGYLRKDSAEVDLVRAIQAVRRVRRFSVRRSPRRCGRTICASSSSATCKPLATCTEREELLQLLAEGKYNKEAASILDVSVYTVDSHSTHLMQKLNLHNTAEIV